MTTGRPPRPRFIAGAKCPDCGVEDRITVAPATDDALMLVRACVACGFEDRIDALGGVSEPETRFLQPEEPAPTPVRLIDPDKSSN